MTPDVPVSPASLFAPPLEVGGLSLKNPLLLAPLAGVTIPSLRLFFSKLGAGAVHTEMISCAGLLASEKGPRRRGKARTESDEPLRARTKTERMLSVLEGEAPVIAQFFAGDTEILARGAAYALSSQRKIVALGINMACPMPKVLKKGAGSKLLERPDVAFDMVRRLVALGLPVWPKIRKCSPSLPLSTETFCEGLLEAGAATVTVHGRTPAQRYAGEADTGLLPRLASLFPGRICASGDVFSPERAAEYLNGGCVAVMLARGAIADPFLFPRTLAFIGYEVHNKYRNPSPDFQLSLLLDFGENVFAESGPRIAVLMVKRLLSGMFKGLPGIGELRRAAAHILSWKELRGILETREVYFERREEHSGCAS